MRATIHLQLGIWSTILLNANHPAIAQDAPALNKTKLGAPMTTDFKEYLKSVQSRIDHSWMPDKKSVGPIRRRITIIFKIQKDGSVTNIRQLISSGVVQWDTSAIQAVTNAGPLAPLPKGCILHDLDVEYEFQLSEGVGRVTVPRY